ncbi:MAG: efflux RND transporter periplasmic adaptor subunit [Dongiaceae bacterium]
MHTDPITDRAVDDASDFNAGARILKQSESRQEKFRTRRRPFSGMIGILIVGLIAGLSIGYRDVIESRIRDFVAPFGNANEVSLSIATKPQSADVATETTLADGDRGRILYYGNPMGFPDTSPTPKKDSMGMDYIPVYENEVAADDGSIRISPGRIQTLGVTSQPAELKLLTGDVKAFGTVVLDETRVWLITTKLGGWIEELHVSETGVLVDAGAPLFELFSPDLYNLELEYIIAATNAGSGAGTTLDPAIDRIKSAALQRLRNWDVPDAELQRLDADRTPGRTLLFAAPAEGRILERMGLPGMRIEAGEPIYRMADLSTVWVIAEVDERDIAGLAAGVEAEIELSAFAGERFAGVVKLIYPEVDPETRRVRVRIDIPNEDERLRPGMLAEVMFTTDLTATPVIAIPDSAVLDSGTRQIVFVDMGEGRYQPRPVRLGRSAGGYREVQSGISPGERVVTSANFLLDSESNLQAALNAFANGTVAL